MSANACVFLLGIAREVIVAARFGIRHEMDAFYAALTVPSVLSGILLSTFSAVFIPVFLKQKTQNREESSRTISIAVNYFAALFFTIAALLFIFAPGIINLGFHGLTSETSELAARILRALSFFFLFSSFSAVMMGILNAHEKFAVPAFSSVIVVLSTIGFVLFAKGMGIFALVYGFVAGACIQMVVIIPFVFNEGYRYNASFSYKNPAVKTMLKNSIPYFFAIIISELNMVIGRTMASYLSPGSIASLGYADKLISVPISIFSTSIATAVFPYFSMQIAEQKVEEMKSSVASSIKMAGFILIPLTVMFVILGRPIIEVLYQRGAFDAKAAGITSIVFICYSFQLFFYTSSTIMSRVFLVLQDIWALLKVVALGLMSNLIFILIFTRVIHPSVAGIALSASLASFVVMSLCFYFLGKKSMDFRRERIQGTVFRILLVSLIMGIAVFALAGFYRDSGGVVCRFTRLVVLAAFGAAVFVILSKLFGIEELKKTERILLSKFPKRQAV